MRHRVADVTTVKCPYCEKKFYVLGHSHLFHAHKKTLYDVIKEFPTLPTMTLRHYNDMVRKQQPRTSALTI